METLDLNYQLNIGWCLLVSLKNHQIYNHLVWSFSHKQ